MAVNGIPLPGSVNHESNMYPGIVADWEYDPLVFASPQSETTLFRVDVTGKFQPITDISPYVRLLGYESTNKWKIEHVHVQPSGHSKISFTMTYVSGHPTLNSKMRVYKAAVELEDLLLRRLLPFAKSQFSIDVTSCSRDDFTAKFSGEQGDSSNEFTAEWLNSSTIERVYTWMTTVVPTFVQCWMPDDKISALDTYDTTTDQSQNGEQALSSNNDNALLVVVTPTGNTSTVVISKNRFEDKPGSIRHACKVQTMELNVDPTKTLRHTKFLDMQYLGTTQQVLFRKTLASFPGAGRVFCVFPSFDEFPGLLSGEAAHDATSRLHCQPDATDENGNLLGARTVFRTFGITQCPGEELVAKEADTCQSSGGIFRVRKPRGCPEQYLKPYADPTCCEIHFDGKDADIITELRIYGNRTIDSSRDRLPILRDVYDWFAEEFGIEGTISLKTDDFLREPDSWKAFKHFMPNCHTLSLTFDTENGLRRAIDFMRLGTEKDLVYNAMFQVYFRPTFEQTMSMLKLLPQNKTELIFVEPGDGPDTSTFMRMDTWLQTLEHQQIDISYGSEEVYGDDHYRLPYHNYNRVMKMMVSRGYRVGNRILDDTGESENVRISHLRKNHVELTIESQNDRGIDYTTTVRFRAGTKHRRVPMNENRKSARKRKIDSAVVLSF